MGSQRTLNIGCAQLNYFPGFYKLVFDLGLLENVQPIMEFSQLICRGESRLESKLKKKYRKTDFEQFLISHFLSLRKIYVADFYLTLHEC